MSAAKKRRQPTVRATPATSAILRNGSVIELVRTLDRSATRFALWEQGTCRPVEWFVDDTGRIRVPFQVDNTLIAHEVMLLPSWHEAYGSQQELLAEIHTFISTYVALSDSFARIVRAYVLLTWVFDTFNELPYLRVQGDFGSGKTRFLQVVGSICYRPLFASGASSTSAVFHLLDSIGGTLIIDEADFRFSDETADMAKLLNNGNVRGMPVLRAQVMRQREFEPRAFAVFSPKLVAMRGRYADRGLESRFLTETMHAGRLPNDMPLHLPSSFPRAALDLRNKLLRYRFDNWAKHSPNEALLDRTYAPRLNQMALPLLSIIEDEDERAALYEAIAKHSTTSETEDYQWEAV